MKMKKAKSNELKVALENDLDRSELWIKQAKDISDAVPYLQDRQREIKTLLYAVEQMPEDVLDEFTPKLLGLYQPSLASFGCILPDLPSLDSNLYSALGSTGTASVYHAAIISINEGGAISPWLQSAKTAFEELAEHKSKKATLPLKLNTIHTQLGKIFRSAVDSFEKSKVDIVGLDQAASRLRDFIQQLWGALTELTRAKCNDQFGTRRYELKKPAHREIVAHCLAISGHEKQLLIILDEFFSLYQKLSPISKDALFRDTDLLSGLYTQWLLDIDDLLANVKI